MSNKEILDVRKVIERSTSKVSLRDLEKKGFRQVKVLRAGDINQLIYKAVQTVLAKNPVGGGVSEAERQRILDDAKAEYEKQLKAAQQAQQAMQALEAKNEAVETRAKEIQEGYRRLEQKVQELNAQATARQRAFEEDKRQFDREKQTLYEKGLDTVNAAAKHYQTQIDELRAKLEAAEGAVSKDAYRDLEERAKDLEARAKSKVEDLEHQLRTVQHELELARDAPKSDPEEVAALREELALANQKASESSARMTEMFTMVMNKLKEAPQPAPAAASSEIDKQLKSFAQGLTDQMRKIAGSASRGGSGFDSDVSLAGINLTGEDVKLETNINDVAVKEQSAKGVKDKLSKLRNMRGGGAPK